MKTYSERKLNTLYKALLTTIIIAILFNLTKAMAQSSIQGQTRKSSVQVSKDGQQKGRLFSEK